MRAFERPCSTLGESGALDSCDGPVIVARAMADHGETLRIAGKVNLCLAVHGRRDTGYHELSSILVPISLYDEMRIEVTSGLIETVLDGEGAGWNGSDLTSANSLTTAAARLLRGRTGCSKGARIFLKKRIPIGGGLGGGSANAAATLRILNAAWEVGLGDAELLELGFELGCDVPALLHGGAVSVTGAGEFVEPVSMANGGSEGWTLVIANPQVCISTQDIFARHTVRLTREQAQHTSILSALREGDVAALANGMFNSLETTAVAKYPILDVYLRALRDSGAAGAMLSGSGASMFGVAESRGAAEEIAREFRGRVGEDAWCEVVTLLPDATCPMV